MDASTQTTRLSRNSADLSATQSRGDLEPPNKEHEHQWTDDGEAGTDPEERVRSELHDDNHSEQRDPAAFAKALDDEESTKLDGATNDVRAEGTQADREDTTSDVGGIQIMGQSLRRRPGPQSQAERHLLAVRKPQDAVDHASIAKDQETYLLKVCRALMMYGAPTHRLEEYMHRTADALDLNLQSFYMPGCMIISFNDTIWRSKDVHIVRCTESLNLSKLADVHAIYKDIIHRGLAIEQASARIDEIMARSDKFPLWVQVLLFGLASACIGPVSYGARPIDLPIIFLLGSLLGFMQLILAQKSELYAHVFELSIATLTAFIARAFGSIPLEPSARFCFSAICQAPLVMILPGFTITSSALELQSKNIVSGSVRLVYGIIFTLFLAFGITIGITLYGAIDSNATSATHCATTWPFWWQILFVPLFTLCYTLINQGKWRKMPATIALSLAGWTVNHFSAQAFSANAQIAQALAALTIGILANIYSRLGRGLAVSLMHPAIFINVPGSLAAGGSLIGGLQSADDLTHGNGSGSATTGQPRQQGNNTAVLNAGYAMIEIGIGITVGLSVSALVVYPFRKKKGKSGLFSF